MGAAIAIFRKASDSSATKLEGIVKEIASIELSRRHNQQLQKKIIASLVIYSILIYLVAAILFFVYYFPSLKILDKFLYSLPLLVFPLLVFGIKKFLHWYFVKRIADNDLKLADLKERKNKIIEDVMENETYKKATEILEKFAPNRLHKLEGKESPTPLGSPPRSPTGSELRQRSVVIRSGISPVIQGTVQSPRPGFSPVPGFTPTPSRRPTMQQQNMYGAPPGPPLPRQVLPRERTYVDKMFDMLVGDGPQNRFALICKLCHSHNGMALREEFDYLSFRCCYCFNMNEARRKKPNAPRLNLDTTINSDEEDLSASDVSDSCNDEADVDECKAEDMDLIGATSHVCEEHNADNNETSAIPKDSGDKKDD